MGRATAWLRGPRKTPQDKVVATMAVDYAAFLRQTPWYEYPFTRKVTRALGGAGRAVVRGWERRLGIGLEFQAKAAYAKVIARRGGRNGAGAAGHPQRRVRTRSRLRLRRMPDVKVVGERENGIEIETPRYDLFTRILVDIARQGGTILEIAGNDEIMVSVTVPDGVSCRSSMGPHPAHEADGIPGERLLVNVRMPELAVFLNAHPLGEPGLEHIFDY